MFECSPVQGVGIFSQPPLGWTVAWRHIAEEFAVSLGPAHERMLRILEGRYGPGEFPKPGSEVEEFIGGRHDQETEYLHDGRPVEDEDSQLRARGIQPHVLAEFEAAFASAGLPAKRVVGRFGADVPLEHEWWQMRWPKLIVGGEGAFFSLLPLARPGTTLVMVYNSSRDGNGWMHSAFHSIVAQNTPWVRLIVYSINRGYRVPASELATAIKAPFEPGVSFLGADNEGRPYDLPETTAAADGNPPRVTDETVMKNDNDEATMDGV